LDYEGLVSPAFALERLAIRSGLSASLKSFSKLDRTQLIMVILPFDGALNLLKYTQRAFLTDEPLLPLPVDVITQYRSEFLRCACIDNEHLL
jgi:hypothetical protein